MKKHIFISLLSAFLCVISATSVRAEAVLDGTMGSTGSFSGAAMYIPDTVGQTIGSNLFHSFSTFNVNTGENAIFDGPASIDNIISRVTGAGASTIDGGLSSWVPTANLFLINPNGIMFGPNAWLDIDGSFHASTADYLKFSDGNIFYADPASSSTLTAAAPAAFGFLSANPAPISVDDSWLWQNSGESLSLVGGDLDITGSVWGVELYAPGANLNLVAVNSAGEATLSGGEVDASGFAAMSDITITNSLLEVSDNGNGKIYIQGGQIVFDNSEVHADNLGAATGAATGIEISADTLLVDNWSWLSADAYGTGNAGNVQINTTGSVSIVNSAWISSDTVDAGDAGGVNLAVGGNLLIDNWANITSDALWSVFMPVFVGNAGNININAANITISNNSYISSSTDDIGRGGDINLTAAGTLSITDSYLAADTYWTGNAGSINISASNAGISGWSWISSDTYSLGNAGNISVNIANNLTVDGAWISSDAIWDPGIGTDVGNAGTISITAANAAFSNFAYVSSENNDIGSGGSISVDVANTLSISDSYFATDATWTGDAGDINLNANTIIIDGWLSNISSSTSFSGNAGNININANNVTISNGAYIDSSTTAGGNAGSINVNASNSLTVDSFAFIESNAIWTGVDVGNAGTINISAGNATFSNFSFVSSDNDDIGKGGTINVNVANALTITDSFFSTSAYWTGDAGSINISANSANINGFSWLSSDTGGQGNAGNINLNIANALSVDGAYISSDSYFGKYAPSTVGDGGNININAGAATFSNGAYISSTTSDVGNGGSVSVDIDGALSISNSYLAADSSWTGHAGNINISANSANIYGNAWISSDTWGPGNAGNINMNIANSLAVNSAYISSDALWAGVTVGNAGNISITAGNATLSNGAYISSVNEDVGLGGDITLNISDTLNIAGSYMSTESFWTGDAGSININANNANINGGSWLNSDTGGQGNAGNINLNINGSFSVNGSWISSDAYVGKYSPASIGNAGTITINSGSTSLSNSAWISSDTRANGNAGLITLNTGNLSMNNASITSETYGTGHAGTVVVTSGPLTMANYSAISSDSHVSGDAGNVIVTASNINMSGSSKISSGSNGSGNGGNILVQSASDIYLSDNAGIKAESTAAGGGLAGDITVIADKYITLDNAYISTEAIDNDGGNIEVWVNDMLFLVDSRITTSVGGGLGAGGNILIDPIFVILLNSQIIANAYGGPGGNITIITDYLIKDATSVIQASSALGISGSISISSPDTDVSGSIAVLPDTYLDASRLMAQQCSAKKGLGNNSLIVTGNGGLPADPASHQHTSLHQGRLIKSTTTDALDNNILWSNSLAGANPLSLWGCNNISL